MEATIETDRKQFSFRGPYELHQEVHAAASRDNVAFAEFCRRALWDAVSNPRSDLAAKIDELEGRLNTLELRQGVAYGEGSWDD